MIPDGFDPSKSVISSERDQTNIGNPARAQLSQVRLMLFLEH
jgi:hypothetical protein